MKLVNVTSELGDLARAWRYSSEFDCWCLEDVGYAAAPTDSRFQRLHIYAPGPYLAGGHVSCGAPCGAYDAASAPVVFHNESGGYMQMPPNYVGTPLCEALPYLRRGMVFVSCGCRGVESKDAHVRAWCGKAPTALVDLKSAIRFLRHNRAVLPGDYDRVISVGMSSGGALSTLLGVTGDNPNYLPYLEAAGAFIDESDAVFAAQAYCPITDLDHADMAYEWNYRADAHYEPSIANHSGELGAFERALSERLAAGYIDYFNGLGLKEPASGTALALGADGRSGSGYDYLLEKLSEAATKYLTLLEAGALAEGYSAEEYLAGGYAMERRGYTDAHASMIRFFMGRQPRLVGHLPDITAGTMLCLMPKGMRGASEPKKNAVGSPKPWLSWDGTAARVDDLDRYVLEHRRRYKPCPAFDAVGCTTAENRLFGDATRYAKHFCPVMPGMLEELQGRFPERCGELLRAYEGMERDEGLAHQRHLMNPFNFLGTAEQARSTQAQHFRVRTGAFDADSSFMVSMSLALRLQEAGIPTSYELVWEQPHCHADYPGEVQDWIDGICL